MATAAQTGTEIQNFIDGECRAPADGASEPVLNPATGEEIATSPLSGEEDVDAAVQAAKRVQRARSPPREAHGFEGLMLLVEYLRFSIRPARSGHTGASRRESSMPLPSPLACTRNRPMARILGHGPRLHVLQPPTSPSSPPGPDPCADTGVSSEALGVGRCPGRRAQHGGPPRPGPGQSPLARALARASMNRRTSSTFSCDIARAYPAEGTAAVVPTGARSAQGTRDPLPHECRPVGLDSDRTQLPDRAPAFSEAGPAHRARRINF